MSTSPGETPVSEAEHIKNHANMWRMVDDFWDRWDHVVHEFAVCRNWPPSAGPGHWPDADMIPFGRINLTGLQPGGPRRTRFTRDEQYTVMSLFAILRSPLMFGGNLPDNDAFTNSLLTNNEVLYMHQKSVNNRELYNEDGVIVWTADDAESGDKFLALFFTGGGNSNGKRNVTFNMSRLGFTGKVKVRDMWQKADMGEFSGTEFAPEINLHGVGLYRLSPVK